MPQPPISKQEYDNATQFLLEWMDACENNQVDLLPELLSRIPGQVLLPLLQNGVEVSVTHNSLECLTYIISNYPQTNCDRGCIQAAGEGKAACLSLLLPMCPDPLVQQKAFRRAIVNEQQETFDILFPLCNPHEIRQRYFSANPSQMLDDRIEQERLQAVLKTATQLCGSGDTKSKI